MASETGAAQRCRVLLEKALARLLEHYNTPIDGVVGLEVDFDGPRVIVQLEPGWAKSLYVDASPDGVEATITLALPEGLDPGTVEAAAEEMIENDQAFKSVAEYDVAYDPETGELNITLQTDTLNAQPTGQALNRLAERLAQAGNR